VAISGRSAERLDHVKRELENLSPEHGNPEVRILSLIMNLEHQEQVDTLVSQVIEKFGRLDALINNAEHIVKSTDLLDRNFFTDFQNVLQVNLFAATRLAQLAAPYLIRSPRGVIVNVCSFRGAATSNISNSIAKAGISMFTKTLANEFEGSKVRVVAVAPGSNTTLRTPETENVLSTSMLDEKDDTEEVANVVRFLESEEASFVHGCTIDINTSPLA